jgi:hypothetical protein
MTLVVYWLDGSLLFKRRYDSVAMATPILEYYRELGFLVLKTETP